MKIAAAAALAVVMSTGAVPADAATVNDGPTIRSLESREVDGAQILRAAAALAPQQRMVLGTEHALAQARSGRLVDQKRMRSAVVGSAHLTWETGVQPVALRINRQQIRVGRVSGETTGLEMLMSEAKGPARTRLVVPSGAGMSQATGPTGFARREMDCFGAESNGNRVDGCKEKFDPKKDGSKTRDYYVYNRWGTATGHEQFGQDAVVHTYVSDTHPNPRYKGSVKGMVNYWPHSSDEQCAAGGSVGLNYGSFNASVPLSNCESRRPKVNTTAKSMGMRFDEGIWTNNRLAVGLDYNLTVYSKQGKTTMMGYYEGANFCGHVLCKYTKTVKGW